MSHARAGNARVSSHAHRGGMHAHAGFAHPRRNVSLLGIQPGMKVADFGAGSGAYVLHLAEDVTPSGRVYAIDVQKDLLRRIHNEAVRRGLTNVDILWGDLEAPHGSTLGDATVDFVVISNLLFQVDDRKGVLREASRIMRPHAKLAIIDWSESFGGLGPARGDVVSKEEAVRLAADCGFSQVKEFAAGAHHYGLVCKKNQL